MDKKIKRQKLLMLDHLVHNNGDKEQIKALRAELGRDKEKELKVKLPGNKSTDEIKLIAKSYLKMKAMEMQDFEITFCLGIAPTKLTLVKEYLGVSAIEEGVQMYEGHKVIKAFKKNRKGRWRHL